MDIVVELVKWDSEGEYDRLGFEENTQEILGVKLSYMKIPVSSGRERGHYRGGRCKESDTQDNGASFGKELRGRPGGFNEKESSKAQVKAVIKREARAYSLKDIRLVVLSGPSGSVKARR